MRRICGGNSERDNPARPCRSPDLQSDVRIVSQYIEIIVLFTLRLSAPAEQRRQRGNFRLLGRLGRRCRAPGSTSLAGGRLDGHRRRRRIGPHDKALSIEKRGLAGPLAFDQRGADFRRRGRIVERPDHEPKLHAKPVVAFLDRNDRPQRRQLVVRFEQAPPQRAQARASNSRSRHRRQIRFAVPRACRSRHCRRAGADATTSGMGAAVMALAGVSGSISFAAAESGGAMIDFEAISGVAGDGSGLAGLAGRFDRGDRYRGRLRGGTGARSSSASVGRGCRRDRGDNGSRSGILRCGWRFGRCGGRWRSLRRAGAVAVCRAIAPVTESSPCSRTVTRAYSRSRSPFRVSTADASRRASFWLSFADGAELLGLPRQIVGRDLIQT